MELRYRPRQPGAAPGPGAARASRSSTGHQDVESCPAIATASAAHPYTSLLHLATLIGIFPKAYLDANP